MEETAFQIHSNYDHKALKTMSRVLRKTVRRKRSMVIRAVVWLLAVLYAFLLVLLVLSGGFPNVLEILVELIFLAELLFEDDLNAWIAARNLLPGTKEADTRFGPSEYVVTTQATETRMRYENIGVVGETKDSFVFVIGKRHCQLFPKSGLQSGTPDEFRAFIEEKTGLTARYTN